MADIKVLDCTLRDGGRVIDCAFKDEQITGIVKRLMQARIDLIEIGFLRDSPGGQSDTTFFSSIEQIEQIIPFDQGQKFTIFIDHGMYCIDRLSPCKEGRSIGIRYGFTKSNFENSRDTLKREMLQIKQKGYQLYFQGVNTVGYTDQELLDLITLANEVVPNSFAIVDTYGAMYQEDLERIFSLVDYNLNRAIDIDFHAHNNMQMAFALAQQCIKLCQGKRRLIVDATLDGMGKCAGNLNTELIVNYLNEKCAHTYQFDYLLDAIDEYIDEFRRKSPWGYTIPAFMAGIYRAHPNNVIYLTNKFRISTKDIRKILSLIDEKTRQRYDYDNIQRIYRNYFSLAFDDSHSVQLLNDAVSEKSVLVVAPGKSLVTYNELIESYIQKEKPLVISVNFIYKYGAYAFFGNNRRYQMIEEHLTTQKIILMSNVEPRTNKELIFNFVSYIAESGNYFDNSTLMLLNLLRQLHVKKIRIAGMDGFYPGGPNYFNEDYIEKKCEPQFEAINRELEGHLYRYMKKSNQQMDVALLTPSRFERVIPRICLK